MYQHFYPILIIIVTKIKIKKSLAFTKKYNFFPKRKHGKLQLLHVKATSAFVVYTGPV